MRTSKYICLCIRLAGTNFCNVQIANSANLPHLDGTLPDTSFHTSELFSELHYMFYYWYHRLCSKIKDRHGKQTLSSYGHYVVIYVQQEPRRSPFPIHAMKIFLQRMELATASLKLYFSPMLGHAQKIRAMEF